MFPRGLLFSSCRTILRHVQTPQIVQRRPIHHNSYPAPCSNMPFALHNRFSTTAFFCIYFGIGLWAPFIIVWYKMAKRTM